MLHYLKIFSWFLFTFGVVGLGAAGFGLDTGLGTGWKPAGLFVLQILASSLVLFGFRLCKDGVIESNVLLYGGWTLIIVFIIAGQIWLNLG
jgi:hypothetical protein